MASTFYLWSHLAGLVIHSSVWLIEPGITRYNTVWEKRLSHGLRKRLGVGRPDDVREASGPVYRESVIKLGSRVHVGVFRGRLC